MCPKAIEKKALYCKWYLDQMDITRASAKNVRSKLTSRNCCKYEVRLIKRLMLRCPTVVRICWGSLPKAENSFCESRYWFRP